MNPIISNELYLSHKSYNIFSLVPLQYIVKQVGFVQQSCKYQETNSLPNMYGLSQEIASTSLPNCAAGYKLPLGYS